METEIENKIIVYVRAIDLAFFMVKETMAWERIVQRRERTKELYEQLNKLSPREDKFDADEHNRWHQQLDSGETTIEQLRQELLERYEIEQFGKDKVEKFWAQVISGEVSSEQQSEWQKRKWRSEREAMYLDSFVDKIVNAKRFPSIRATRDFGSLRLVISPDGVTDELCYEFRSLANSSSFERQLEGITAVAHVDAFLLKRANIMAHVHVRTSGREQIISEPANVERAQSYLNWVEGRIQYFVERWPNAPEGYWG